MLVLRLFSLSVQWSAQGLRQTDGLSAVVAVPHPYCHDENKEGCSGEFLLA